MSFNTYLLSILTSNTTKRADVYSLSLRYQALWIIYSDFLIIFAATIWKLSNHSYAPSTGNNTILASFPIIATSLVCLKKGKNNFAAGFALVGMHTANFASGFYCAIAPAYFQVLFPGLGFLVSSSARVHVLNFACCILENIRHMYNMETTFKVTFTEHQRYEIIQVHIISFMTIIAITILFAIQNTSKNNLWKLAQSNFVRTEEIAKEMVQVAKAKDIFVSSLSHEIRNPLNCMNGSIDYLLQIVKEPSHLQLLNNAKMSGEVLLNLLSNVLDAAKLKAEKMELFYIETNVLETVRKVLILFCEKIREKRLKATIYIDRALPQVMWTDPSRILQILINLFSNALKFSEEGGIIKMHVCWCSDDQSTKDELKSDIEKNSYNRSQCWNSLDSSIEKDLSRNISTEEFNGLESISRLQNFRRLNEPTTMEENQAYISIKDGQISKKFLVYNIENYIKANSLQSIFSDMFDSPKRRIAKKGFLKIQISDNGCGIKQENIPKLFEMFSQADNTVNSSHGGSGLGLWICKQLCQKMGGDITLHSQVDIGTTFVFYLPINNNCLSLASLPRMKREQEHLRGLVVDDYPYNRDMHKLILERENVQVVLASDGKQAVDIFTGHEEDYFQFIMMDAKMPVMDGFTAAKKIREWEAERNRKRVDIYFVSGEYFDEEEVMRELRRGGGMVETEGIRCLKKPIDVEQIKGLLEKFQQGTE